MFWKKLSIALVCPFLLCAEEDVEVFPAAEIKETPWFTGPLICPSPHTIPAGHFNLEPYLFYDNTVGTYNNSWKFHSIHPVVANLNFQGLIQMGLLSRLDLTITPQFFYNLTNNPKNPWAFGDLSMKIGIQLVQGSALGGIPSLKLSLGETFPLGKYDFLDDNSNGTDAFGGGSFGTSGSLVAGRLFHFGGVHFLSTRAQLGASVFSGVTLHGVNAYGGDQTTNGTFHPGGQFNLILGGEFAVTKQFVIALDIVNVYTLKSTFHGTTVNPVGNPYNSYQLSFAPAVEWNFNQNVGLIGGVWLTAVGVDTSAFINGVIALNWYI